MSMQRLLNQQQTILTKDTLTYSQDLASLDDNKTFTLSGKVLQFNNHPQQSTYKLNTSIFLTTFKSTVSEQQIL